MNRRTFLLGTIALLLSNQVLAQKNKDSTLDVYIDESGYKGSRTPLVFGALVLNSKYSYDRLDTIRNEANFKPILRYSSSNKYKKRLAVPFINEFFGSDFMSFSSIIIPSTINSQWPSNKKQGTSLYHHNYSKFIQNVSSKAITVNIFLEKRTTSGADLYLKKFIEKNNSQVLVRFLKEKESNCIQLSDLLTGSIYGDLTNVKDKTKLDIINEIKKRLDVSTIAQNFTSKEGRFSVKIANQI